MASIKDLFIKSIGEGMKAAEMIPDASQKANAYAALANALARTGLVNTFTRNTDESAPDIAPKESLKPETNKGKRKTKEEVVKEEIIEETPAEEEASTKEADEEIVEQLEEEAINEASENEIGEEWTEEALETLKDEVGFISYIKDVYDEEVINQCIAGFSDGIFNSLEGINPLNIKGFVAYMQALMAETE